MGKGSLSKKQERIDRLIGLLKSGDFWTTSSLSHELEISHRTLMRDLAELREAGYPIESDRGRGGGVRIDARYGIDRLQLSHKEVISLLTSLALTQSLSPRVFDTSIKSIAQKISRAFPAHQRKTINQFRERILVGESASEEVLKSYGTTEQKTMNSVTESFFSFKKLQIHYQSESGQITQRAVEPHYLLLNWPAWYLLCWDELRDDVRVFRVDRILKTQNLDSPMKRRKKEIFLGAFEEYFSRI